MKKFKFHIIFCLMLATTTAQAQKATWGDIDFKGEPWVKNVSRPNEIS